MEWAGHDAIATHAWILACETRCSFSPLEARIGHQQILRILGMFLTGPGDLPVDVSSVQEKRRKYKVGSAALVLVPEPSKIWRSWCQKPGCRDPCAVAHGALERLMIRGRREFLWVHSPAKTLQKRKRESKGCAVS